MEAHNSQICCYSRILTFLNSIDSATRPPGITTSSSTLITFFVYSNVNIYSHSNPIERVALTMHQLSLQNLLIGSWYRSNTPVICEGPGHDSLQERTPSKTSHPVSVSSQWVSLRRRQLSRLSLRLFRYVGRCDKMTLESPGMNDFFTDRGDDTSRGTGNRGPANSGNCPVCVSSWWVTLQSRRLSPRRLRDLSSDAWEGEIR